MSSSDNPNRQNTADTNIDDYQFDSGLDASVSSFFSNNKLGSWTFDNFRLHYLEEDPNATRNKVLTKYRSDIKKICENENIEIAVRCKAGNVLQDSLAKLANSKGESRANDSVTNNVTNNTGFVAIFGGTNIFNNNSSSSSSGAENEEERRKKRLRVNLMNEDKSWDVENEEDLWDAWRQYLEDCERHDFCLEKYHVIECGYSIQCNPHVPSQLYEHMGINNHIVTNPFIACQDYTSTSLRHIKNDTWKEAKRKIEEPDMTDLPGTFVQAFLLYCMCLYKKPNLHNRLALNEANYNHLLIWPMLELVVDNLTTENLTFVPGECNLKASCEGYKGDAVIIDKEKNELFLLETSGRFALSDNSRFGFDHIKGAFGGLTMFNAIIKKYCKATIIAALKLRLLFVHARGQTIHVWSLELCSRKLYAMKKLFCADIPASMIDEGKVLLLGILFYCLMINVKNTSKVVKQLQLEHSQYDTQVLLGLAQERESLASYVSDDIKRPERGSNYGILLPKEKEQYEVEIKYISE